ncbi:MAG: RdgB/HAM1 family non-canonical purine NTP pyrophosphatase [Acidobacteria bacterium]|nr:RdgB/HAM1 family non-canonical purine NTP pyrophosphatase [Acidobacteriota bacterium]
MTQIELVFATANADKVSEIRELMPQRFVLHARPSQIPEVAETGSTLLANARLKAAAVCAATGSAAVADDTGLEVDALGGDPGVHSARFAGPRATSSDNIALLLESLSDVEFHRRTARFRTVAMVMFPDGRTYIGQGTVEGEITEDPRGSGGFGYDPVFRPVDGDGRTFAEMTTTEKNGISHRARAFVALCEELERVQS